MHLRAYAWVLLALTALASRAAADDWKVAKLDGDAMTFRNAAWIKLKVGDVIASGATTRTFSDSALRLERDKETIALSAKTEIKVIDHPGERYTTVREYEGAVGVEAEVENVRHFEVQTALLTATVKGTIFGVVAEPDASTVIVSRGVVTVMDLPRQKETDIHAGQSAKVRQNRALVVGSAADADADTALAAATALAATRPSGPGLLIDDPAPPVEAAVKPVEKEKPKPTPTPGMDADEVDPDAVAAAANGVLSGGQMNESDAEAAAKVASQLNVIPGDDGIRRAKDANFKWTKVRQGRLMLKSVFELVAQMRGFEKYGVFLLFGMLIIFMNYFFSGILKDNAFGFFLNLAIILASALFGVMIRDFIFYDGNNLQYEPYMTVTLVFGSIFIILTGACIAKARIANLSPAPSRTPSRKRPLDRRPGARARI